MASLKFLRTTLLALLLGASALLAHATLPTPRTS